ncbi:MAG: hypothetical protein Kow0092_09520 [Deferrisomatales bacterium]
METRERFRQKMEQEIQEIREKLDQIRAAAEKATAEVKKETLRLVDSLGTRQKELRERAARLGDTTEEAWKGVRNGLEKAVRELKESVEHLRAKWK